MKIKLHRYIIYGCFRGLAFVVQLLPLDAASAAGGRVGRLCFWLLPRERKKAITHLTWVFEKEKSKEEIRKLAKEAFTNLGRTLFEFIQMQRLTKEEIINRVIPENLDRLDGALRRGKGAILLTGHFGNWEWLAAFLIARGHQGGALGRRIHFAPYNNLLVNMRRRHGVETYDRKDSPKKILKLLAENKVLGVLPDQDVKRVTGIFIPFFGRDAYTPTGPVAMALASGAAVVPAFLVREGNKFRLKVEEPLKITRTRDKEADLRRHTLEWSGLLERYLRLYPDHWVWMHDRWQTTPETVWRKRT